MAEIKLRLVIDSSGAIRTFEETMNALAQRAGATPVAQKTLANLRLGLESLRQELEKTEIGSQRFNELRRSIELTEKELRKASTATKALDDTFTKIGLRLNGITSLFSILSSSFGGLIRESNAGELAVAKLTQALQNQGEFSQAAVDDLRAFAAARQEATAIDDDATVSIIGQLAALGLQDQALKNATIAVQDLATLMDGDMQGALRLVADAFQGNTEGLKRMKIEIDETDLKTRGATAVVEALTKAIGGQAVAAGSTAAGEIKKLQLAMDDWRQTMGDVLKSGLQPVIGALKSVADSLKESPASLQAVVLGLTAMGAAFAFVNSSAGILPYAFIGLGSAILIIVNAIKEGNPLMAALGAGVGVLGIAVLALNAKLLLMSTTITTIVIPALTALKVAVASHPILLLITGIAAVGAALWAMTRQTNEASDSLKRYRREIEQLSTTKLEIDVADTIVSIADLSARIDNLKKNLHEGKIQTSPEIAGLELQLQLQRERLKLLQQEQQRRAQIAEEQRKQAAEEADPKIQLELRELRIKAMQDGLAKELALLDLQKDKELQKIDERAKAESLSEKQVNDLKAATVTAYAAERNRILQESYERERAEWEKSSSEYYDYTQHLKRLDEGLALDLARTDEERYNLKRSFLEKEIADLEQLGPRTLEQEKRLAEARAELKRLNNAEMVRLERERQDLERQLRELRTGDIVEDSRREIEAIRDKYARLRELAIKHGEDITAINRAQAAEEREAIERKLDATEQRWRSENKVAMGAIDSITAGIRAASNQWLISYRQAASEMDAIWLAIRNSAIGALTNILATLLENAIVSAAVRAATTAATVASMTAIAAAAAPAALAVNIASFGSAGLAAASSTTAAAAALQSSMAAMAIPFARGGQFEPDQVGFIEGRQYELIAPRRTFEDIMRGEIVPMLISEARTVAVRNASDEEWKAVRAELRLLRSELRKKNLSAHVQNIIDDKRIVRTNLVSAEQYWMRKRV